MEKIEFKYYFKVKNTNLIFTENYTIEEIENAYAFKYPVSDIVFLGRSKKTPYKIGGYQDIYENDIIEVYHNDKTKYGGRSNYKRYLIKWNNDSAEFICEPIGNDKKYSERLECLIDDAFEIGNIFENPEILNK